MTRSPWLSLLGVAALAASACDDPKPKKPAPTPPASTSAPVKKAKPTLPAAYESGPTDALAKRYCDEIVHVPAARRAECCKEVATSPRASCIRNLSDAVRAKSITIDEAALAACAAEVKARHATCDWPGPVAPEHPEICARVLTPQGERGASCRSSLECKGDLHCHAGGTNESGTCTPPQSRGAPCSSSVEGLAPFTALTAYVQSAKRECAGKCVMRSCEDLKASGQACSADAECAPGHACVKATCTKAQPAKLGAPCGAGCEAGLRCVEGKCTKPRAAGKPCLIHADCLAGACVKAPGARAGKCGMRCTQ